MARSATFVAPPCIYFEECGRPSWSKGMCLMHYKRVWRGGVAEKPKKIANGKDAEYNLNFHGWTVTGAGCWEWQGAQFANSGYGALYIAGETRLAHRVAYETWVGPIPAGLFVCHTCDNRICIAPEHLWLGTNQDNMVDMVQKGRANRPVGEAVVNSVLTADQVREIRRRRAAGEKLKTIGDDFGIGESHVSGIARRRIWTWLD